MRRLSAKFTGAGVRLIFAAVLVLSAQSAYSQTDVALVLQQTPSQGGIISPDVGVHQFQLNSEVTLVAVPKPGYQFVYWLGDVVDPTATKTVAYLNKPKIIIAVFQQVDDGKLIVGQNPPTAGGGGGDFSAGGSSMSATGPRISGGSSGGGGSSTPTEGDDPDPPDDPPDVPEPATGILLGLGALALARRRKA